MRGCELRNFYDSTTSVRSAGKYQNITSWNIFRLFKHIVSSFARETFQPLIMVQPLTIFDFLSNVGGFMGLLAGTSVLSVIEVFYHVVHRYRLKPTAIHPIMDFASAARRVAWVNENHALFQMSKYCGEFIKASDIHGLNYTRDRRQSRCGRIFWSILVSLSLLACLVLVFDIYQNAEKSPVATSIDSKVLTLDEVR